ncbi:hypothetical protein [Microbacterium sp. No. 7]|uniref:hypothetical protein n=1 Tax=Microbacterium sp. No. 7 TaxID=1714373 RepID=UPI0006D105D8|nr:hypothetical protein [Microbacterium sp. No. 7]ALJ21443.1 hypothetical protein AOA12_16705 [Microbacterium sp. No. 7]
MFVFIVAVIAIVAKIATTLHRVTPSNFVIRRVLTRTGYRWAFPVGAAGVILYGVIAALAGTLAAHDGLSAWHLVLLVAIYNTVRFVMLVPWATSRLIVARWREHRAARRGEAVGAGGAGGHVARAESTLSAG